jgi:hypothetical protein
MCKVKWRNINKAGLEAKQMEIMKILIDFWKIEPGKLHSETLNNINNNNHFNNDFQHTMEL